MLNWEKMHCSLFYKVGGGKWISQRGKGSDLSVLYMGSWILLSNLNHSICMTESFDSCRQIWEFHIQEHNRLSCSLRWLNMMNKEPHKTLENIVTVRKKKFNSLHYPVYLILKPLDYISAGKNQDLCKKKKKIITIQ